MIGNIKNDDSKIVIQRTIFISLLSDLTFKTLWTNGSKLTKLFLNKIISEAVGFDVTNFNLSTNELGLNNYKSMANKVDILLISLDKRTKVNVELNKKHSVVLDRKNDVYLYKLAGETYTRNRDIDSNKVYDFDINVIQVNINNYGNPHNPLIPRNDYVVADLVNNIIKEGITFHDFYLPIIKKMCYNTDKELYRNLAMFTAQSYDEMSKIANGSEMREKVMEDLKRLGSDTNFVDLYDHEEFQKAVEDELYRNGIEEGIEKGIEKGRVEGIKEEKISIAKKLLERGMKLEEVSMITDLDKETLEKL